MAIKYISWAPHCSRSDVTARQLGGTSHMVYWERLGSRASTIWLKYLGQTVVTWRLLAGARTDAVFVMSPPPVAVLAVYAVCLATRTPFVIDAHSGAFQHPRWQWLQPLQFWLCRRAAATIVTNEHLAALVRAQGAHAIVVPDVPVEFPESATRPTCEGFSVVCVTSFDRDEPLEAMIEAARCTPHVPFFMTGNPAAPGGARLRGLSLPPNLRLTGFLDLGAYGSLIRDAGAVLALTTDDHTMQRGAWEAIYQGTPVIVSDFPMLREAFDEGAEHVDNSPDAIAEAVRRIQAAADLYRQGAARLRDRKRARWEETRRQLEAAIRRGRAETA